MSHVFDHRDPLVLQLPAAVAAQMTGDGFGSPERRKDCAMPKAAGVVPAHMQAIASREH
jgi:hypothetical protein